MFTFKKGIHPPGEKYLTKDLEIVALPAPKVVYIPLVQHAGTPSTLIVKAGDNVKKGQLIAVPKELGANIHSSLCGTVLGVISMMNAQGTRTQYVKIENDYKNTEFKLPPLKENCLKEDIVQRVKDAGIVGMGGAAFPTHIKLTPKTGKEIDTLIINGCECEPHLNCDYRIMKERTKEFIEGCMLLKKAVNAKVVVIAIEEHNSDIVSLLKTFNSVDVAILKPKYPQGAEKMLIYALTRRKVPLGKLPIDVGIIVSNVQTAYAVYEAVVFGKTSYERVITVSGGAINNPKNLSAVYGTPLSEIVDFCGGFKQKPKKVIIGGPMTGYTQFSLNTVVTKRTSGVMFLTQDEINSNALTACINCARCAKNCPMNLMPMYIESGYLSGDLAASKKYGALHCIECGSCAYNCPANRPLVQSIRLAKKLIKDKKI